MYFPAYRSEIILRPDLEKKTKNQFTSNKTNDKSLHFSPIACHVVMKRSWNQNFNRLYYSL